MTIHRILVAVDGSPNATSAARWAHDLAQAAGVELYAVHAVGLLEHASHGGPVPTSGHRSEIRWAFDHQWAAPLGLPAGSERLLLRDGPPAGAILSAATEVDADLIVVGTRGVGNHLERTLGSTAAQVVQAARCPVTVVPAA